MASGYRNSAGVDADDLYDPDIVGDGPAATGYRKADGSTLRYAAAQYGTPGAAMGYRLSSGVDIGTLWAKKGTAAYVQANPGYIGMNSSIALTGGTGTKWATSQLTMAPDGTWTVLNYNSASAGTPRSGLWYAPSTPGVGASYEVLFTPTWDQDDGASVTNGGASWSSLSGGRAITVTMSSPATATYGKWVTGTVRVQIRRASDGLVVSDQNITVSVHCDIG